MNETSLLKMKIKPRFVALAVVCLLALGYFTGSLCSCEPMHYKEFKLGDVPPAYLARFDADHPGVTPTRAWHYEAGNKGFLFRTSIDGKTQDIKISQWSIDHPAAVQLEPVGGKD